MTGLRIPYIIVLQDVVMKEWLRFIPTRRMERAALMRR